MQATICLLFFSYYEHIGGLRSISVMWLECRFLDTEVDGSNPVYLYVVSSCKTLYPHCFSRLSCEVSTRWVQPREGCSVL